MTPHPPDGGHDPPPRARLRPHQRRGHHAGPRGAGSWTGTRAPRGCSVTRRRRCSAGRPTSLRPAGATATAMDVLDDDAARGPLDRRGARSSRKDGARASATIVVVPLFDDFGRTHRGARRLPRRDRPQETSRSTAAGRRPVAPMAHLLSPAPCGPPPATFHAVTAGFLGWTMDAFDFFVVVFLVDTLAARFGVTKKDIVWTITATLAMRPVGAVIFGLLADRYGRRVPLMANLVFFSTVEVLCGFAPNYATFLVLRALFGIGMGGEWGVGASLAMESAPRAVAGNAVRASCRAATRSAICSRPWPRGSCCRPGAGARCSGSAALPALLAFYIRWHVPESEAWQQHRAPDVSPRSRRSCAGFAPRLVYLVALMTMMMFLSHGTQDLYPDFLKIAHGIAGQDRGRRRHPLQRRRGRWARSSSATLSERIGRRYSMVGALGLSLCRHARSGRSAARSRCSRRRVLHADGRPGSLGHHPGAPERALARLDPRPRARASPTSSASSSPRRSTRSSTPCATGSATAGRWRPSRRRRS